MQVGRDNNTTVNYGGAPSGGNAGRVHAVIVSVERIPLGENLWNAKVNNGTSGPITGLEVDVYVVDDRGVRTTDECVPAKSRISLADMFEKMLAQVFPGVMGAIANHAQGFPGTTTQGLAALRSQGPMMGRSLGSNPQVAALFQQNQAAYMTDSFDRVLKADSHTEVLYLAEGGGNVQADIKFDDEDGNRWSRAFGQRPQRVD